MARTVVLIPDDLLPGVRTTDECAASQTIPVGHHIHQEAPREFLAAVTPFSPADLSHHASVEETMKSRGEVPAGGFQAR
jgi:hypothetical protein